MEKRSINNIRLGMFIIAGILILVVSLYMIGQNQNIFGSNLSLKARFRNINGLMPGNNVRFSGIQCGTVKDIEIINDTTIEVLMLVSSKTGPYIRSNASAAIGTEGLMGNKVVNIFPGTADAPVVADGDMLQTSTEQGLNDVLGTLSATGDNALAISSGLKTATDRINKSPALIELLSDTTIARNLRQSLENIREASVQIREAAVSVNSLIGDVQAGKGAAGVLLADPKAANEISEAIHNIHRTSGQAEQLVISLDSLISGIQNDINHGTGTAHLLFKDSSITQRVQSSLENIERGTASFSEDMEALKHNFLLRGYFRKQERKKNK